MKRIRRGKKATWLQRQAAWEACQRDYRRRIRELRRQLRDKDDQITTLQWRNDQLQAEREQRHREQVQNWNLYDQAYAETTRQELALFEASPAYQKYQEWRKAKRTLPKGDWKAP